MTVLNVLTYPDKKLRIVAKPVVDFDAELAKLAEDMLETMYAYKGIGLAATQIDCHIQLVVMDLQDDQTPKLIFANPKIKLLDHDKLPTEEGCLSVPNYREKVFRHQNIELSAQNLDGSHFSMNATGLLSVCIQHEADHLKGTLFVNRLSELRQLKFHKSYG